MQYYIYGVVHDDAVLPAALRGYADTPLELISSRGLSAVVSELPQAPDRDPASLVLLYQAQQRVLTGLCARGVLPTKLGCSLSSREAVSFMLHVHAEGLAEQLAHLTGTAQFNLSVNWQLNREIQLAATSADVRTLRAELQAQPEITLGDQARIGELIAQQLEYQRHRLMDRVLHAIEADLAEYGVVARDGETTAFNLALLARSDRRESLLERLASIEGIAGRLEWQLSEALPATAFRSLEVIEPSPTDLERARSTLRLPANAPLVPPQVQRAYKRLALEKHPDRRQDDANAEAEMRELSWARDLLEVAYSGVGVRVQKVVSK